MEPMKPMKPMKPMEPMEGQAAWWPEDLGEPSTAGSQDDIRYAYFADRRRLAISRGGEVVVHDTGEHQITGAAQQQGGQTDDVHFATAAGDVALARLPVVA